MDSVVLSDLLKKGGYQFDLAHCNFQLRGMEANDDTQFCENYAKTINCKCYVERFNTREYALEHKLSIQMAARELRYNWFKELMDKHGYSHILTAHHANDNVETIFVNLVRGTGIKGLQGIPEKQRNTVRPLLFATKEEIKAYSDKNDLKYREDSSNQEVKYKRNFIRHQIITELKKLNPALEETLTSSIHYFKQSVEIVTEFAASKFGEICKEKNNQLLIDIKLILKEKQKETLLYEWLQAKNFKSTQIQQLTEALTELQHVGKQFVSATHKLVIDRKFIIVQAIKKHSDDNEFVINSLMDTQHLPIQLSFLKTENRDFSTSANEIKIAYTETLFPLTLRKWKQGDKFKPFGMTGFKKLSDFFKDQKFSLFEKENTWILESKEHIVWIVGYRMDDRCRITNETTNLLTLKIQN